MTLKERRDDHEKDDVHHRYHDDGNVHVYEYVHEF